MTRLLSKQAGHDPIQTSWGAERTMNFSSEPYSVGGALHSSGLCGFASGHLPGERGRVPPASQRSLTPCRKERWLKIAEHWLPMAQEADKDTGGNR
jgi:hypothetical protein